MNVRGEVRAHAAAPAVPLGSPSRAEPETERHRLATDPRASAPGVESAAGVLADWGPESVREAMELL